MMLLTKYQGSRRCGFRQVDFFLHFSHISLCKTCDPWTGPLLAQGSNLIKIGRAPLGDATYQITRLSSFWFQIRRFLKLASRKSVFSLCDLDMQRTSMVEGDTKIICVKLIKIGLGV